MIKNRIENLHTNNLPGYEAVGTQFDLLQCRRVYVEPLKMKKIAEEPRQFVGTLTNTQGGYTGFR